MRDRRLCVAVCIAMTSTLLLMVLGAATKSPAQVNEPYQSGTITKVAPHVAPGKEPASNQYDVSVKVGNKIYVVLYIQPPDRTGVEYGVGMRRNVLVQGKTMKMVDMLGVTHTLPILSSRDTPVEDPK